MVQSAKYLQGGFHIKLVEITLKGLVFRHPIPTEKALEAVIKTNDIQPGAAVSTTPKGNHKLYNKQQRIITPVRALHPELKS
jgi:hypothetical protein